jgi:DNA-binding transcriptional LysR family regulator
MRNLEAKLGQALFVRQPGQTPTLSAAGQALLAFAQETLQRAQAIHAELGTQRRQLRFAAQRFVAGRRRLRKWHRELEPEGGTDGHSAARGDSFRR